MARTVNNAEAWEAAHEVFTQVNFNAFDYNSVKESLLDYTKLYYPEDFNDYIESDEYIAILEAFAYVSELIAYRLDLNGHENLFPVAQRKESILRLAKFISYSASRNIVARGLVKISSIQTTENVVDSSNNNLAGKKIIWNDNNNINWKEQFLLVINRVLEQEFGTVSPNERVQLDDVLFELYTLNNNPLNADGTSVFSYNATVTGQSFPMELVPSQLSVTGPSEKRPEINSAFSLLYATDGLGDASNTTGFLIFTKQGTLTKQQTTFDGVTPNQTFDITVNNINQTDVWVNNVNPTTDEILTQNPFQTVLSHNSIGSLRYGEWVPVDLSNAQNILFNTNPNPHKYEIETLDGDQIRLIFGDGEFADIPSGTFDLWYRTSANQQLAIPASSVINQQTTFTYQDSIGNVQTLTFTFSLTGSLLNAAPTEDIEHIRRVAPSVYYTQDRMVNDRDYNSFPLQDPTILKLRTVNRTFAGDSKYIFWYDPKDYYQNVKIFGDDLALYWVQQAPGQFGFEDINSPITSVELVETYIEPLLCSTDLFGYIAYLFAQPEFTGTPIIRCQFKTTPYSFPATPNNEFDSITQAIQAATSGTIDLWYSPVYDEWTVGQHYWDINPDGPLGVAESIFLIQVTPVFSGSDLNGWNVQWASRRMIAQSSTTSFWNANTTGKVIDFDTLSSLQDYIAVLSANLDSSGNILGENINFTVTSQELVNVNTLPNAGLPDPQRVDVITEDVNGDSIPDNITVPQLFNKSTVVPVSTGTPSGLNLTFNLIQTIVQGQGDPDLKVYTLDSSGNVVKKLQYGGTAEWVDLPTSNNVLLADKIQINNIPVTLAGVTNIRIDYVDNVYLFRSSNQEAFEPIASNDSVKSAWATDQAAPASSQLYTRNPGRFPLNFAWYHFADTLNLIDPAPSNIMDMFIITSGYYFDTQNWLLGNANVQPTPPTPLELSNTYGQLFDSKMISDTVIPHSGQFKILFGSKSAAQLQATFLVVRPSQGTNLTDNEVKVRIVSNVRNFFDIQDWEQGETFFFSELSASIHSDLGPEISSVVLVPLYSTELFGDLYEITPGENELFLPDITTANINIVQSYTSENLKQNPS